MPGEFEIISKVRSLASVGKEVLAGIGDDAAVIATGTEEDLLACCDLCVEGIHFRREWAAPSAIGHKALAVNISDIAAMGGVPRYAMVSIAIPQGTPGGFVDELFTGLFGLAQAHGISIVGGDTSGSPGPLFIDVSLIGGCSKGKSVRRSGARPGDLIFVTGSLGGSAQGLRLLETGYGAPAGTEGGRDQELDHARQQLIDRQLRPEPRLTVGQALGRSRLATAMIDVSDGLVRDLGHILEESDAGAVLTADAIPVDPNLLHLSREEASIDPLDLALHGGEEYELVFTSTSAQHAEVERLSRELALPITLIGEITAGAGLKLQRKNRVEVLLPSGFEHSI
ncbi:MAG TPA: thiamine-phosphate kinase [Blastocatellia bacterium]|nr:thiamine-phosphate kinase [Blastocatellia bacterium]